MRISDWSSDVCSSDLRRRPRLPARSGRAPERRVRCRRSSRLPASRAAAPGLLMIGGDVRRAARKAAFSECASPTPASALPALHASSQILFFLFLLYYTHASVSWCTLLFYTVYFPRSSLLPSLPQCP